MGKCPVVLSLGLWKDMAGFDVDDCDEVEEGRTHVTVNRRHGLTSSALPRGRSIPIRMWFWKSHYKATYLLQYHSVL